MACAGMAAVRGFRRPWGSWSASLTDMGGVCDCVYALGTLGYSRISMVEMPFNAVHPRVSYPPRGQEPQVGGIYTVEMGRCYKLEPLCPLFEVVVKHL